MTSSISIPARIIFPYLHPQRRILYVCMYVLGYNFHKVCLLYDCKIKRWYECKKIENLSKKNTGLKPTNQANLHH